MTSASWENGFFLERFGFISETGREKDGEADRIRQSYHNKEKI